MDMLRTASQWLNGKREEFLSTEIRYVHYNGRQDYSESTIPATRGRSIFKADNGYGVTVRVHLEDFIVSADKIGFKPNKGDEIFCDGKRFEVLAPNDEPVWRWCGNNHDSLRIHTKDMGEE